MSRHRLLFFILTVILVTFSLGLLMPFDSWSAIFLRPWHLLWGSSQQLNATLLEASSSDSVLSAGQHLLKPFGTVTLLREVETENKPKS